MIIKDVIQKIKLFLESSRGQMIYLVLVIILATVSSFGLGRLSKTVVNKDPVRIEYSAQGLVANASYGLPGKTGGLPDIRVGNSEGLFVASQKGKKYYPINCPAGNSLKEENKIFFNTEAEAEVAGYTRSTSC